MDTWLFPIHNWIDFSNSILPVLLLLGIFMAVRRIRPGKPTVVSVLFGLLFSVAMVFGAQLDDHGSVPFTNMGMWLVILLFGAVMMVLVSGLWQAMEQAGSVVTAKQRRCALVHRNRCGEEWEATTVKKYRCALKHKKRCAEVVEAVIAVTTDESAAASVQADTGKAAAVFVQAGTDQTESRCAAGQAVCYILRAAAVIFGLYFIVFLAVYPGFFVYDAQEEYLEVVTRQFTTHHPLLHVLFMGGIVQLFYKLYGSVNTGIAAYTLVQMAVLSGVSGCFVWKMAKRGLGKWGQRILILYLGLCPPIVMFALCSAKDGLFTGMLLLQVLLLQELCREPEQFFKNKIKIIFFIVATLGMMLLRNNGCYAFAAYLPFLAFWMRTRERKKKECISVADETLFVNGLEFEADKHQKISSGRKILTEKRNEMGGMRSCTVRSLVMGLFTLLLYMGINQGLAAVTHAEASEHQEMLTVPIMQLARTCAYEPDSLTDEQKETLYRYLPEEAVMRYTPKVSDGVKISFDNAAYEQDKSGFWKLWAQVGAEHPFSYLNAWLMTSYGFWYPDTVIDVYRGNTVFTYTYEDSSYFGYEVEEPGTRESKILWLDELYRKMSLELFQQKVPLLSMLFSPGFLFWCMMFGLGFLLNRREKGRSMEAVLPFVLPLLVFLTFLLGPTYLVRYVVFWWVLVPLLAVEIYAILTGGYADCQVTDALESGVK